MNPEKDTLPLLGKAALWFFLDDDDYFQAIGDFEEAYRERMKIKGSAKAKLWFWFLLQVPSGIHFRPFVLERSHD